MDDSSPYNVLKPPPPMSPTRSRKRRDWIWLFMLAPILLAWAIGWGVWTGVRRAVVARSVSRDLPNQLAAAAREGLPLTAADLRRIPPIPESENAAPLYREITRLVAKDKADGDAFSDYLKGKRDPAATANVRQLIAKWAEPMRLAEGASRRPYCDFQRHWEQGPDVMFPELAQMRAVVRALSVRAIVENADGSPIDALSTVETAARISHHAGEDPIIIGLLVEVALQAIADRPFREIVFAHMDDPAVRAKAQEVLAAFNPPPDIDRAFRGEVVMSRVAADVMRREPGALEKALGQTENVRPMPRSLADAFEVRILAYWRSVFRALKETKNDPLDRYRRIQAIGAELQTHECEPTYELCDILMPVFVEVDAKALGSVARQRLREGCLAIAGFYREHGRFPSEAEAGALIPRDPFTERPLIYRPAAEGFVMYSVGDNLKDDGGTDKPAKKGDPMPDIVVRYPAASDTAK